MKLKKISFLLLIVAIGFTLDIKAQQEDAKIKAAFIYNFTRYFDWPEEVKTDTFYIGIESNQSIYNELLKASKNRRVKVYEVKETNVENLNLHILYSNDVKTLNKYQGKSVLLISELEDKNISMVQFRKEESSQKYQLNQEKIDKIGLKKRGG